MRCLQMTADEESYYLKVAGVRSSPKAAHFIEMHFHVGATFVEQEAFCIRSIEIELFPPTITAPACIS
jgi:hypothetical protein